MKLESRGESYEHKESQAASAISIVVPAYNEAQAIPIFFAETEKIRQALALEFEYIFVNDGSTDHTLEVLKALYDA
ncbi:MAG: glycosyltransferase, partial [Streptococcaceae bacterium]|nr:glycosyltransferase [Streptococcaceae bacterium]